MSSGVITTEIVYEKFTREMIEGDFNDFDVYREAAHLLTQFQERTGRRPIAVEVGAYHGRSTACLAELLHGTADFYVVDTWKGTQSEPKMLDEVRKAGGSLFPSFRENLQNLDLFDFVLPLEMTSREAFVLFPVRSVDFVYIDADHRHGEVLRDLDMWVTRVRSGGIIAGHDITWGEVRLALNQFCEQSGLSWERKQNSWWIKL